MRVCDQEARLSQETYPWRGAQAHSLEAWAGHRDAVVFPQRLVDEGEITDEQGLDRRVLADELAEEQLRLGRGRVFQTGVEVGEGLLVGLVEREPTQREPL